ncbi:MAG: GPR endopeptidase [Clostridiales bacterium]|jgi:spore protease|nr:GPR endopeptidase [Clostridiales bacterium]
MNKKNKAKNAVYGTTGGKNEDKERNRISRKSLNPTDGVNMKSAVSGTNTENAASNFTNVKTELKKREKRPSDRLNATGGVNAKNNANNFTDMAIEFKGLKGASSTLFGGEIKKTASVITRAETEKYGKPEGLYITLECGGYKDEKIGAELANELTLCIAEAADFLNAATRKILVVGVGNILMTADALGPGCANKIKPVPGDGKRPKICTLIPNVIGMTGIESFDIVSAAVEKVRPDLVIAIDTLAANRTDRLSKTFQLSTCGLQPGGGVKNHRPALNRESLGVPVIAVGVPLVVSASRLALSLMESYGETVAAHLSYLNRRREGNNDNGQSGHGKRNGRGESGKRGTAHGTDALSDMIVTVKDINLVVEQCSEIISSAINSLKF